MQLKNIMVRLYAFIYLFFTLFKYSIKYKSFYYSKNTGVQTLISYPFPPRTFGAALSVAESLKVFKLTILSTAQHCYITLYPIRHA